MTKRKSLLSALALLSVVAVAAGCTQTTDPTSSAPATSVEESTSSSSVEDLPSGGWTDTDYVAEGDVKVEVATSGSFESFVASSYAEREEILGKLEKYAMENNLTGLVLYDDGGYVKYADRVVIPTPVKKDSAGNDVERVGTKQHEYVVGYGFGIVSEGKLEGNLGNADIQNPSYWHSYETTDPGTLNYMNDKGSVVGGYHGYVSGGYFSTRLDAAKTGYEWYPQLASEANLDGNGQYRPTPLNTNAATGLATKYRIYVRTGDDLVYNTLSANAKVSGFKGREVVVDDYLTPFKELHNQKNGMARGAENLTGAAAIKGMAEYYNGTANGYSEEAWAGVGIKTGTDPEKGAYLDFEFVTPTTPFYAMYYLSSSLYAPIPAEFLEAIGGINVYQSFGADGSGLTPVDTTLSTGPYCVETWTSDASFTFKKNELMSKEANGGENRYQIPGIHIDILAAATSDPLAAWKEYEAGNLDGCGIPSDVLQEALGTKGTQTTKGSSTTKLNVNTCTPKEWEYLFGENGTVAQTKAEDYWKVEPALSNDDFLMGLNLSLNRTLYAENHGVTPSLNYFSDAYLSDPEAGTSYNATQTHKDVLASIYGTDVDTYGYNPDKAIEYFQKAMEKLLADGTYKEGDEITIEIAWQAESQIDKAGAEIKEMLEEVFNDPSVCGNKVTLKIENMAVAVWSDVYYKKMMIGQFDIGFGGINGNTLNPLNFMEVLKSDNSSGFTLNWGPDTNDPNALIEHAGKQFTYDALWQAADTGALVASDGTNAKFCGIELVSNTANADGSRTVVIAYGASQIEGVVNVQVEDVILCWYSEPTKGYDEQAVGYTIDEENKTITVQVSATLAHAMGGDVGFDVIFTDSMGNLNSSLQSVSCEFPVWDPTIDVPEAE